MPLKLSKVVITPYVLDVSMLEINPLVVTRSGELVALDAKMGFDDNALFRQQKILNCATKPRKIPAKWQLRTGV